MSEEKKEKTLQEQLQEKLEAYKEELKKITSIKDIDKEEEKCIKDIDEFDEHLKSVTYKVPAECEFEGKSYSRKTVANKIAVFLAKNEVDWRYALGMYELIKLWKSETEDISFGALDSTLRMLGQVKYKGLEEWQSVLIVNEFMKGMHDAYSTDLTQQIFLAQMHNSVLERRDMITPIKSVDEKEAE